MPRPGRHQAFSVAVAELSSGVTQSSSNSMWYSVALRFMHAWRFHTNSAWVVLWTWSRPTPKEPSRNMDHVGCGSRHGIFAPSRLPPSPRFTCTAPQALSLCSKTGAVRS